MFKPQPPIMDAPDLADKFVDDALDTYKLCRQTAAYCMDKGGDFARPHRIQALEDCAHANLLMADLLLRASRNIIRSAPYCRDVSKACAEMLGDFERGDPQFRAAYAACTRSCSNCERLLGHVEQEGPDNELIDEASWESFPASDPMSPPS